MRDHVFTYSGDELIVPLQSLIEWTERKIVSLEETVRAAKAIETKANIKAQTLGMALGGGSGRAIVSETEKTYHDAKWSLNRAKNWIREARRTPTTEWVLEFSDLDWLYRPQRDS